MGIEFLIGTVVIRGMNFKLKIFYNECDEALAQVAQRSSRWPILGNIQGQIE